MNLSIFNRILIVIGFSVFSSALSWFLSEPPIAESTKQYREFYENLPDNGLISEEEYNELKNEERQYIEKSTTKKNFRDYVRIFLLRKATIVTIISLCWVLIALKLKMHGRYLILSLLGALAAGAFFISIIESIWYAAVFLSTSLFGNKKMLQSGAD